MSRDAEIWAAWARYFPFALRPVFHDLWITVQHLHEAALGQDLLSDSTSEFAYPRAVLLLRHVGIQHVPIELLGWLQGVIFTVAVVLVLRPRTPRRALATSLVFFTPPLLLGIERANIDLALFCLCVTVAWQWARNGAKGKLAWPIAAGIAGALLKIYPLFVLFGGAIAEVGRRRVLWLVGIALVLGYWVLNQAELALIIEKVPVSTSAAWGCLVFFARVERVVRNDPETFAWLADVSWPLVAVGFYALAAGCAAYVGFRLAPRFASTRIPRLEWAYFWIGTLICCGSFVGANLAYRWIFVLFTLPLLLRALRSTEPIVALWAVSTIVSIMLSLGPPLVTSSSVFALIQATNWLCVLLLVVGCTALRVTAKSPIFAFFMRLFSPSSSPATDYTPAGVPSARAGSR